MYTIYMIMQYNYYVLQDLEVQYKTKNEELENIINLRDIYNCDLERVLKEADEQTNKFNRVNSRIQFDTKKIDKKCDVDKRNSLELIKVRYYYYRHWVKYLIHL